MIPDEGWIALGEKWGMEWAYRYRMLKNKNKLPYVEIARRPLVKKYGSQSWRIRVKVPIEWLEEIVNSEAPDTASVGASKAKKEKPKETADQKIDRLMKKLQGKAKS